ncbi:MAG: MFS transporter [Chloroflexia bacterium]
MSNPFRARIARSVGVFTLTLLAIEFLDEMAFGAREAAWPLIRDDLGLDYMQVGVLLGLPNFIANFIEPFIGILGDVWRRRALVLGGGVVFGLALLLMAFSESFPVLLVAFILFSPASGAFVSLSQATLMDTDPARHEHNMARWTFAGSLGVVAGTLAVGLVSWFALGWRPLFAIFAGLTLILLLAASRFHFPRGVPDPESEEEEALGFKRGVLDAVGALKRREVLRWLTLLEFSDLMLDVLLGFLALYFVDVVGVSPADAALAVTVWTVVGLAGDFLIIRLLERVPGLTYLRVSAGVLLLLYPAFLLAPYLWAKFGLVALLGLFNAGWYSILKGNLYSSMPGRSGTVMAVGNVFGLVGSLLPVAIGAISDNVGLGAAMWILLLGPVALLVGLPRATSTRTTI